MSCPNANAGEPRRGVIVTLPPDWLFKDYAAEDLAKARAAGEAAGREAARKDFERIIGSVLGEAWVDEYRTAMGDTNDEEQDRPQAPPDQAEGL